MNVTITITLEEARAVSNALHNAVCVMGRLSSMCVGDSRGERLLEGTRLQRNNVIDTLREWDAQLPGGEA